MLNFVATTAFTLWVAALRTRLSRCGHAWGRCSALQAVACCVVAPTQTRPQRPTRARPTAVSRFKIYLEPFVIGRSFVPSNQRPSHARVGLDEGRDIFARGVHT